MRDKLRKMTERQWLAAIVLLDFRLRLAFVFEQAFRLLFVPGNSRSGCSGDSPR